MGENDYVNDSMLQMYLFETSTLLEQLDEILIQSEKCQSLSTENINEIFRIMHTIKSSSAMMEYETISLVSHKLEDLFFYIRENDIKDTSFYELFDLVFEVSDFLKEEIQKIQQNKKLAAENYILIDKILEKLEKLKGEEESPLEKYKDIPKQNQSPEGSAPLGKNTYLLHVLFASDCQMENIRAFMLVNKLKTIGQVLLTIPEDLIENKQASAKIANDGFLCSLSTDLSESEVAEVAKGILSVDSVDFIEALPGSSDTETIPAGADTKQQPLKNKNAAETDTDGDNPVKSRPAKQNLINVDLNKLDALMDLVGEIVITESLVSESADLDGLVLDNFSKAARQLRKLTDELQDIVMSIRMIPVASTFQKMQRIVRDMNKKLSRDVELVLMGESTEVDKTIIDGIHDPLMHLVRNAMDHGIEDKATRIAAKKDPNGRIVLSAQNVGGEIIISVSDDGKGLDPQEILEKAKSKNLLSKPESEYTEKEIFNFLTLPGFSTRETVTEYSGRGVGMDVVKKNIEKIGGSVMIESEKGLGTNIFFKIPLTLAIMPSMEIKAGNEIYTIPISNIRESFKAETDQVFTDPDGNEMIMIRGKCYPIIRLQKIYNLDDCCADIEEGVFLLVESRERSACIFADELIGKHQVVVKPLPYYLSRYNITETGVSGCTILGNGSISLILDVQGILNKY